MVIKVESTVTVWKVSIGKVEKFKAYVKFISIHIYKFKLLWKYIEMLKSTQWILQSKQVQVELSEKKAGSGHEVPQTNSCR